VSGQPDYFPLGDFRFTGVYPETYREFFPKLAGQFPEANEERVSKKDKQTPPVMT
jgi:hypothetical protein